jgi:hypothetical protein
MAIPIIIGWLLCVGGGLIFPFKLYVAFTATRGIHTGGVPLLDGAILPPLFVTAGVAFLTTKSSRLPFWAYCLIWFLGAAIAFTVLWIVQRSARRRERKRF